MAATPDRVTADRAVAALIEALQGQRRDRAIVLVARLLSQEPSVQEQVSSQLRVTQAAVTGGRPGELEAARELWVLQFGKALAAGLVTADEMRRLTRRLRELVADQHSSRGADSQDHAEPGPGHDAFHHPESYAAPDGWDGGSGGGSPHGYSPPPGTTFGDDDDD